MSNAYKEMLNNSKSSGILDPHSDDLSSKGLLDGIDIPSLNKTLESLNVEKIIKQSKSLFPTGKLFAMTSAGIDSALMMHHIAGKNIPVIFINTGYLRDETLDQLEALKQLYKLQVYEVGPSKQDIKYIADQQLWDTNPTEYRRITKLDPLEKIIKKLGIAALLSGIHRYQTPVRSHLKLVEQGNYGEIRIHPFIDWTKTQVEAFITRNKLPRNALYYQGYTWIDDWPFMGLDKDKKDCGIHLLKASEVSQISK